jgi:ubiquinone/menaquinone biosynthesis C-methylase UbiE
MVAADMNRLPFPNISFDLIWSGGAAYVNDFDKALREWRSLAKPGGSLVVSELSWSANSPSSIRISSPSGCACARPEGLPAPAP